MLALRVFPAAALALCVIASVATAGTYAVSASCDNSNVISVSWTFYEYPPNPTGHPEWVGWDVYRQSLTDCGSFVRVSSSPFARTPGATEGFTFTEAAPSQGTTFKYRVIPVDASRNEVNLGANCEFCAPNGWVSCPELSAPLTQGTLTDIGWALLVNPCAGSCYDAFYISPIPESLKPFAGTDTGLRLFGSAGCGTVEGCALTVDHFDVVNCGPVPALRASWGRVKATYR